MNFTRKFYIFFLCVFFVRSDILSAGFNHDWDNECQAEIYQKFKQILDFEKLYEDVKKGLTQEDRENAEKTLEGYLDELTTLAVQCHSAYDFDLMSRVSELARKDGREDIASLIDVSCRSNQEDLSEVTEEHNHQSRQ